jgi:AraC-like DNA-binding protein
MGAPAKPDQPRGLVRGPGRGQPADGPVRLARLPPPEDLAPFVEHFWIVSWRLPDDRPLTQATLPHPCIHWTAEDGASEIVGVYRGRFERTLRGQGRVIGVKFRPAGFCAFHPGSLHLLCDRRWPAARILGRAAGALGAKVRRVEVPAAVEQFARCLRALGPRDDPAAREAGHIAEHIARDRELVSVEAVASRFGRSPLALQRLFRAKVGVSPKWVIQRYRLHEAVERIVTRSAARRPSGPPFAHLAAELGFTDQAHFCRVFKAFLGESPTEYARRLAGPARASGAP